MLNSNQIYKNCHYKIIGIGIDDGAGEQVREGPEEGLPLQCWKRAKRGTE